MIIPGTEVGAYGSTGLFLFKIEYLRFFSIIFPILFQFRLLQNIEQSSLCYTVDPCWLSTLNIAMCRCQSQQNGVPRIIQKYLLLGGKGGV